MKQKSIFVSSLFCATLLCAGVFMTTVVHSFFYAPENELSLSSVESSHLISASPKSTSQRPLRLIISSLHIDAKVQDVGIGRTGNMAVPNNFTDVGWYRYGPIPGDQGSAVMDGHVDNALAFDGVFKHLSELQVGDPMSVILTDGEQRDFIVYDVQSYSYDDVPIDLLFHKKDGAYLNLVTCGGEWDQEKKSYDRRVVVFAKKLE